jgi:hypothetical protein
MDASRIELPASRAERYSRGNYFLPTAFAVDVLHVFKLYLGSGTDIASEATFHRRIKNIKTARQI